MLPGYLPIKIRVMNKVTPQTRKRHEKKCERPLYSAELVRGFYYEYCVTCGMRVSVWHKDDKPEILGPEFMDGTRAVNSNKWRRNARHSD